MAVLLLFTACATASQVTDDGMGVGETTTSASSTVAEEVTTESATTMVTDYTTDSESTGATDTGTTVAATTAAEGLTTVTSASDIEAYGLSVTSPTDLIFDLDVDNIVTYSVVVRNSGGTDIAAPSSGDNFGLAFLISSHADPTDVDASTVEFVAEASNAVNLDAAVAAGSTVTITGASAMINIPSASCSTYQYTCVQVSKASDASYTDSVSTNNYYCLAFGDVAENLAGLVPCSGCALQVSMMLLLATFLLARFLS